MKEPTTGYLVWRVSLKWRAAADRALAPLGLTHAQYAFLASLHGLTLAGRRPSQRELADYSGLEALYVSKLARAAERDGLVVRAHHPADPRAVQVTLTDHGRDTVTRAIAVVVALNEGLAATLGSARHDALHRTLQLLLGHFDEPEEGSQHMTTPTFTGRDLNLAAQATRDVLNAILVQEGIGFHRFVALRTIGLAGPTPTGTLCDRLAADLRVDVAAADGLLAALVGAGLAAQPDGRTALTAEGETLFARLEAAVGRATAELYDGIDPADLAATARVLVQVTERASARLRA